MVLVQMIWMLVRCENIQFFLLFCSLLIDSGDEYDVLMYMKVQSTQMMKGSEKLFYVINSNENSVQCICYS